MAEEKRAPIVMGRAHLASAFMGKAEKAGLAMTRGVKIRPLPRLKTGSIMFDIALGGGIPLGRTILFKGDKSTGKTTTTYRICGLAQRLCANCHEPARNYRVVEMIDEHGVVIEDENGEPMWQQTGECDCYASERFKAPRYAVEKAEMDYDARIARYRTNSYEPFVIGYLDPEGSLDTHWAMRQGFDTRVIFYRACETAEETIDVYDGIARSGAIDLIMLDSIAAMTPSVEIEESSEKQQRSASAKLNNKWVRKAQAAANAIHNDYGRVLTQIWLNQLRTDLNVKWGDNQIAPGGKGQGFAASIEATFTVWISDYQRGELDMGQQANATVMASDKVKFHVMVDKNKTSAPKIGCTFDMWLTGPNAGKVDDFDAMVGLLEQLNHLGKDGSKWMLGMSSFKTKSDALAELRKPDVWARWYDQVLSEVLMSRNAVEMVLTKKVKKAEGE